MKITPSEFVAKQEYFTLFPGRLQGRGETQKSAENVFSAQWSVCSSVFPVSSEPEPACASATLRAYSMNMPSGEKR
jgi:hypothetical protein